MTHVDTLSRLPSTVHTLLSHSLPVSLTSYQRADPDLLPLILYFEKGILPVDPGQHLVFEQKAQHYRLLNSILFHIPPKTKRCSYQFPEQIVIPAAFRSEILSQFHDSIFGGHLGVKRTREKIQMRYFWPSLDKDVENWVGSCTLCSTKKNPPTFSRAPLVPINVSGPFDRLAVDVVGPLPQS